MFQIIFARSGWIRNLYLDPDPELDPDPNKSFRIHNTEKKLNSWLVGGGRGSEGFTALP